ncbi:armadillo repeat-containing protein 10 isoform X2 [Clupea harengus]|uniref:Armadillo repeat-containing protein 10 isoform X2 n=1 Tax=Clupea harengus TaxID=7950 RepID=A0A6P8FB95_CLUHA|nr:armadillo repeat-containing protein 10 isoform X2 [Clupea harengus]
MGDGFVAPKLGNMKAVLGILAGAGASYGLYKLVRGIGGNAEKKNRTKKVERSGPDNRAAGNVILEPGSLMAKVSGFNVVGVPKNPSQVTAEASNILTKSPGCLEPRHIGMLLSLLQSSPNASERSQVLITLGNSAAFTVNQDLIREFGGLYVIAGFLTDTSADVRLQTLNALNNLSMNIRNQEQLKVYIPQVLELIEISPVNSELQLAALRLLTNMSVTDKHQHLMRNSVTLFLSLLVVSNEALQLQVLKVLVNMSSNPDMIEEIVQAQAPASLVLLFDGCTNVSVLLRLLTFVGNLMAWTPSAQVAQALRWRPDSLFCVLLDDSSQLHYRLPQLLSHPDGEVKAQVARIFA